MDLARTAIAATIKRATVSANRAVIKLDAETLRDLQGIYKQAAADIAARIADHAGADGNLALQEMQSALAQVNATLRYLAQQRDALLQSALGQSADLGVSPYLGSIITPAAGMRISGEALNFVRTFVAADGLQLSDRLWRIDRGARDQVVNAIEQAVIQGHGAAQAAAEFMARNLPVSPELRGKANAASAGQLGKTAAEVLMKGPGTPMDNALRLFRTEINRAHGEAYMKGGEDVQGFAGWRYTLSPAHPRPDICDLLSTQNLYGLGPGVYPSREKTPWPAHPNILSFIEIVFENEISEADRAGKETSMEAMKRLRPDQQRGVLGAGKFDLYKEGKITQGMIRTPLAKVKARLASRVPIDTPPPPPKAPPPRVPKAKTPPPKPQAPQTLDALIAAGHNRAEQLLGRVGGAYPNRGANLQRELLRDLEAERPIGKPARVDSSGRAASLVKQASKRFPDDWTGATDSFGQLETKFSSARAFYRGTADGRGLIQAHDLSSAVHEYTHRIQQAIPAIDDYFQDLHHRRTTGDPIQRLRDLLPNRGYGSNEVAQEDHYTHPYQGRIYQSALLPYTGRHGALEVMTMAFESVLGADTHRFDLLAERDREMLDLVVGLLFHYVP